MSARVDTPRAPDRDAERGGAALLIIDMIGEFDCSGADAMRGALEAAADRISGLRDAAPALAIGRGRAMKAVP